MFVDLYSLDIRILHVLLLLLHIRHRTTRTAKGEATIYIAVLLDPLLVADAFDSQLAAFMEQHQQQLLHVHPRERKRERERERERENHQSSIRMLERQNSSSSKRQLNFVCKRKK